MSNKKILSYCRITNQQVIVNGNLLLEFSSEDKNHWLIDIYNHFQFSYPKFYKMDKLCRAGFLAAELIMNDLGMINEEIKSDWAICCFNRSGSLDDDKTYQKTIQNPDEFFPAPSVFVYTLANIVTGEIAIRHKLRGESAFYITERFNAKTIHETTTDLLTCGTAQYILGGWVEQGDEGTDVLLWAVGPSSDETLLDFAENNLNKLY